MAACGRVGQVGPVEVRPFWATDSSAVLIDAASSRAVASSWWAVSGNRAAAFVGSESGVRDRAASTSFWICYTQVWGGEEATDPFPERVEIATIRRTGRLTDSHG